MSRFIDLSAVVAPDIEVQFRKGGKKYRCPGSPETERMLRWLSFQDRFENATGEEGVKLMQEIYDDLLEVFQEYQADLKKLPIRNEQIMPLFQVLFDAVPEEQVPPTPRTRQPKQKS